MTIPTITPASWSELHDVLFDEPWPVHAGEFHSGLIHRGMTDYSWPLMSSLDRLKLFTMEQHLLRNFQKYARLANFSPDRTWEWLAVAQHHGLPTRLMDWTYSPLVALHFAIANPAYPRSSVVWSLDYVRVHSRLPTMVRSAIRGDAAAFTTDMLDRASIPVWPKDWQELTDAYMVILEPPSIDDRIVNQYAGLSAFSSTKVAIEDWLATFSEPVALKIEVLPHLKAEIREKLDKANINERVIYPGLDGLATWLTRYYSTPARTWI
ncbi:FRG domain-containing protein [Nakamurella multipartita]|uniref:FRG domain protein n=1 Tax=Nakamurella multipartita (strain ATCC 700099 / DSM 44233 / CIP 104796 / JCM 9543 / NBRC 105858 / Y-104) TaxID=479431 RepID=C8X685_NAKMY|nr:FRG domain-containing protein [Nakamurella multipartita]ACV76856.1 FRG domain protein [Nakamurella multipartita DSM 44233]